MDSPELIAEIEECRKNPEYFIENYIYINRPTAKSDKIKLYTHQKEYIQDFLDYKFNVICAARQIGFSTLSLAFSVWKTLFNNTKIVLLNDRLGISQTKIALLKYMLEQLPKCFVDQLEVSWKIKNSNCIEFSNGSTIFSKGIREFNSYAHISGDIFIFDQAEFMKNFNSALSPIIPLVSQNKNGQIIICSTPYETGSVFHKLWLESITDSVFDNKTGYKYIGTGKNNFHAIKTPCYVVPGKGALWIDLNIDVYGEKTIQQEFFAEFPE